VEDPRAEDLIRDINQVRRVVRRRLHAKLSQPRLAPAQVELLQVVEERPGIGVSGAARLLYLADNSVSGLVNQLVGAGLLRRETDQRDRRAVRLHLTAAAQARLAAWRGARADLVEVGLERLVEGDRRAIALALPALRRLAEELAEENQ
jgi:DNA-binding MarR family transcriptional regulator